ncbi:5'-methylthioadenosine/S-adenosylhomocysteine nucleosidase [Ruminiclostridium hungatei]|uniref:adenosylhomocysteine nucleosidase n=1 Tax=Ruminiclostridium hungatei TaxID=48256 RepID=A0A1V4SJ69_RUMHU|nr:5'-methylthioadenosine/S-adenosylhomocysteine nucleosidase [Ruminiclostridium hungatei]OPX43291.1 5'-methylthioadenosine/S-adenosylhomocysteine nucleosidase [Ruminiclostridium hungatei]
MIRIAIISAMEIELAPLIEILTEDGSWVADSNESFVNAGLGLTVCCGVLGVGKVNAAYRTAEIIHNFNPELIINVGFAGGLKDGASGGDIVIGNDYRQVDFRALSLDNKPGLVPQAKPYIIPEKLIELLRQKSLALSFSCHVGRIATGDFFLNDTGTKNRIIADFSPVAFDMESAAIAHVCADKGIPFVSVRTLSDLADDHAHKAVKELTGRIEQRPIQIVLSVLGEVDGYSKWKTS